MNAVQLIERVREYNAEVTLQDNKLIVSGRGERLPEELRAALREHRAELMIALGASIERTVANVLGELRPNLPPTLRQLPDGDLLALVNWTIIAAWEKTIHKLES
jgi:hypothetical protein